MRFRRFSALRCFSVRIHPSYIIMFISLSRIVLVQMPKTPTLKHGHRHAFMSTKCQGRYHWEENFRRRQCRQATSHSHANTASDTQVTDSTVHVDGQHPDWWRWLIPGCLKWVPPHCKAPRDPLKDAFKGRIATTQKAILSTAPFTLSLSEPSTFLLFLCTKTTSKHASQRHENPY